MYDAWGNHKTYVLNNGIFVDILVETSYTQSGLNNKLIAQINPFRYRSYYYDTETGLYYLNSRYYDPETGRFINSDNISYLDPQRINGLNIYQYCGNNPVMNVDKTGNFFLSFLIASIVLGALAGGTINAVKAANEGASGWDIFGAFLGGAIMGGATGAIVAIGGAAGLTSIGISVAGFGLGTATAFGASVAIGVGAGMLSYTAENLIRQDREFTFGGLFLAGFSGGFQTAVTFGIAFAGGRAGLFTNKLTGMNPHEFLTYVVNTFGKVTWPQAIVYGAQLLFSNTIAKFALVTLPGAILRSLIEKLIKG